MTAITTIEVDLNDETWGPADAGYLLDKLPTEAVIDALSTAHHVMHVSMWHERRAAKRRPWRWHRIRGLGRQERAYCREVARRAQLVATVANARAEGGE